MKLNKITYFAAIALAMASCSEDKINNEPTPNPGTANGDVAFSASLGTAQTRTEYGDAVTTNNKITAFKVNWVLNDQVVVLSDACNEMANNAVYAVTERGGSATATTNLNIASVMTKVGDHGVQWKDATAAPTGDFYSFYPASSVVDGSVDVASHKLSARIPTYQYLKTWDGVYDASGNPAYDENGVLELKPNMDYAIMAGRALNVTNGQTVDLRFEPLSTVIEVTVNGPSSQGQYFDLRSISVSSKSGQQISGTFDATFVDNGIAPTWHTGNDSYSQVTLWTYDNTHNPIRINHGQKVVAKIFLLPNSNVNKSDLVVTIGDNNNNTLSQGLMHVSGTLQAKAINPVVLPNTPSSTVQNLDLSRWMAQLPRNVYLTEISMPGAWYCFNNTTNISGLKSTEQYQNIGVAEQYTNGVRAFQTDVRVGYSRSGSALNRSYTKDNIYIAGTGGWWESIGNKHYDNKGTKFTAILDALKDLVKNNSQEYVMCIFNLADQSEESATIYNENKGWWLTKLAEEVNTWNNANEYLIYGGPITPNTLLDDVKGHIIIKVGLNDHKNELANYSTIAPILMSESTTRWTGERNGEDLKSVLGWNSMEATTTQNMNWYYTEAMQTYDPNSGNAPTYTNRRNVINNMFTQMPGQYNNHATWFYLGIGGYEKVNNKTDTPMAVAANLNPYVKGKIDTVLASTNPTPVGIVMMNFATLSSLSYDNTPLQSAELIRGIIQLNTKFVLRTDPNWGLSAGEPDPQSEADTVIEVFDGPAYE